jgi:amphi-Trp domain-containing protein
MTFTTIKSKQWEDSMPKRKMKSERDVEKGYSAKEFVTKLRRLADCIEGEERFQIQVAGERISVPPDAIINIEHERGDGEEELEFQLKWSISGQS